MAKIDWELAKRLHEALGAVAAVSWDASGHTYVAEIQVTSRLAATPYAIGLDPTDVREPPTPCTVGPCVICSKPVKFPEWDARKICRRCWDDLAEASKEEDAPR